MVAAILLGQVVATARLASAMRREERPSPAALTALRRLVRGTSAGLALIVLSGVLHSPIEPPPESQGEVMSYSREMVSVRYIVDDVEKAIAFYTTFLDFKVLTSFPPAFADVARGNLRLLLSGPTSSAGRPMADGTKPQPGGWNRIHLIVDDIDAEVSRLRDAGAPFRNDILAGPGGKQILLQDPSGNVVELFQPRER